MKKFVKSLLCFVMLFYVIFAFYPYDVKAMSSSFTYAYIDATELSVRSCPSTNVSVCPRLTDREGDTIWLNRPRAVEVLGYDSDWARIKFSYWGYEYEGYIYTEYLGSITTYTLDNSYANTLRRKGFPESYIEKLCKLHAIHPNWDFEVLGGLDSLDTAVEGEYYYIGKNLVSTTDYSMLSTDPEAYQNGWFVEFEPGWYAASRSALRYYLDPRNFLDDNSIFMFEQLSYNENVSVDAVQGMLNGSFMAGEFVYNGEVYSYARAIVEAGRAKNVNPVHLAARILQEQGYGGSATACMDGGDGNYYYNYFNFGASGWSAEEIYAGALNYAKASGWNNPYYAIMGAADDLSRGYISGGQDTVYLQKFNVNGTIARYSYQYMANIQAPYSESYSSYVSYWRSGLINSSYVFKIPVFADMGETVILPELSSNNNLNSLTISNYNLSPEFDSGITTYNLVVGAKVDSISIDATADEKATIEGIGNITLDSDNINHVITVTAEDGSKKEYKINIVKEQVNTDSIDGIVSSEGLKTENDNISGFKLGTDVSSYVEKLKKDYSDITVKVLDSNDNEITSGLVSTGQRIVIEKDGNSKTYYVAVRGDANGDGKISISDYARVKAIILGKYNAVGCSYLASDANKDGKITISDYAKIKAYILKNIEIAQ